MPRIMAGMKALEAMLSDGELDAAIFGTELPEGLRTVFPDIPAAEADFRARHGFVPVNHLVVLRSELARDLTRQWRLRFNSRWPAVVGSTRVSNLMTFYSPDHPAPFTPREIWASGITSLEQAMRLGFIGICDPRDNQIQICEKWMNDTAPSAERFDLTSRRYFHGKAGPAVKWKIWIKGPEKTDDDEK